MFTVLGELQPCGITETETCLKSVVVTARGTQTVSGCGQAFFQISELETKEEQLFVTFLYSVCIYTVFFPHRSSPLTLPAVFLSIQS